jgi:hypothetical protein
MNLDIFELASDKYTKVKYRKTLHHYTQNNNWVLPGGNVDLKFFSLENDEKKVFTINSG